MPTKRLPEPADLDHLKHQAKDLLRAHRARDPEALQRIREFHPRLQRRTDADIADAPFALSDAQLAIAREYGYASWPRLKARVERPTRAEDTSLPPQERITDPEFRRAIDLLDAGAIDRLRAHLATHPQLARQRVPLEGGNYFRHPTLLEFCAENPIRHDRLPPNIVDVARLILDAGAKEDPAAVTSCLSLVCSGRVPRECGVQVPLIDLLCDHGADADGAMVAALGHGEFAAVAALLRRGARVTLPVAAAMGNAPDARQLIASASADERHLALALACQFGRVDIVRGLLDAGEDPSRYNPVGTHSHSTPLHQAVWAGHAGVVDLLLERGARTDLPDTLHHGTALDWAWVAQRDDMQAKLRAHGAKFWEEIAPR